MAEEVLIFNIGDESTRMKVGRSYLLLGVAQSEHEARELAASLPANSGSKIILLAKRAIIRRIPAVRLEDLDEPAAE